MGEKDGTYRCPTCGTTGTIDGINISVTVQRSSGSVNWPIHSDCEWAKTVDDIDVTKLEKIS